MLKNYIYYFTIIVSFAFSPFLHSQMNLSGTIIDSKTKSNVPYVNIGVMGESIGTVSSAKGKFDLNIDEAYNTSIMVFSSIGYENFESSVEELFELLKNKSTINLQPTTYSMEEVVITKQKLKAKTLGNKVLKTNVQAGYADNILGCEVATKINLKRKEQILMDKFYFHIASNTCDSLFFRLNFYDSKGGKPGKNITKQNIFITTDKESGIVEVDLTKYDIWMEEDFYVGLEWIRNFCPEEDKGGFKFASKFFKKLHYRPAGKANWNKLRVAGVGMWMDVLYCKKD